MCGEGGGTEDTVVLLVEVEELTLAFSWKKRPQRRRFFCASDKLETLFRKPPKGISALLAGEPCCCFSAIVTVFGFSFGTI